MCVFLFNIIAVQNVYFYMIILWQSENNGNKFEHIADNYVQVIDYDCKLTECPQIVVV